MAHSNHWVSVVALMIAACGFPNHLLIGVANVKFMDLFVSVSGIIFGPFVGASVVVLT